jgi:hypothetical protein
MTHQSVQNLWGGRGASDVLIHGLYAPSLTPVAIEIGSVKRLIKVTTHGAVAGDYIRMENGTAVSEEVAIIKKVDANFFIIAKEINAAIGDTLVFLKPVTPLYSKAGSLTVVSTETPKALTYVQSLTLDGTIAQTFVPPANAKNVKVHAGPDNTINLKVAFGGTVATATVGQEFEPGRSEDYNGVSSISIICKSAITAHAVFIVWSV